MSSFWLISCSKKYKPTVSLHATQMLLVNNWRQKHTGKVSNMLTKDFGSWSFQIHHVVAKKNPVRFLFSNRPVEGWSTHKYVITISEEILQYILIQSRQYILFIRATKESLYSLLAPGGSFSSILYMDEILTFFSSFFFQFFETFTDFVNNNIARILSSLLLGTTKVIFFLKN